MTGGRDEDPVTRAAVRLLVALLVGVLVLAPLLAGVGAAQSADLSDPSPTKGSDKERLVQNAPITLNVTVQTSSPVIVEFRDGRGQVIGTQSVASDGDVSVTWNPDIGSRQWQAVVRTQSGIVLDATSEYAITVTERDPDSTCLEFIVEIEDRNFFCAAAGPFTGVLPLPVLGMVVWGALSMGLFIRTGSPIIPYVLLLLTGGAIGGVLAGPALSLITVLVLAVVGGVPLLLYINYAR